MEGWARVKEAAAYAAVSPRTLREWLKGGLRHSRLPSGVIRIQYAAIDEFLAGFETQPDEVDQVVADVCKELGL